MNVLTSTDVNSYPDITGYSITEQLYIGSKTSVYRGLELNENRSVVVKIMRQSHPSFNDFVHFRNQYIITKNLNVSGIVQPISLESWENGYVLIMEDDDSISLAEYANHQPLPLEEALKIAIDLAQILYDLHNNRVIHKDIKPANIVIHPQTHEIKLIDFSIASLLPKETQEIQNPNVLEGTLAYIAPEQTGRMNRAIDYRADFYSLGVTLYELLTGQLPFTSKDPLELVHAHIAQTPLSPEQINPNLGPVVSQIILKLMAKNAEDRYQSALGLKYDLEQSLKQYQQTGHVENLKIGKQDWCDRFIIPEKLYGREKEVSQLLEAFERVNKESGSSEMMLVAGFSGIGKTAVINEVHKPITRQKGYFIKGKFDQFNRDNPLSAFVQSFRDLIGQLLADSDTQLEQWRKEILEAVGENGQVLIAVIPELEKVIGKQLPVTELSGGAAQTRFNLVFQKFISVFTTATHPLVIFLDDLQWADGASLQLIKLLMEDKNYLLLLGAYRDNEVSPAHPLMLTIEELQQAGIIVNTLTLEPLKLNQTNQLVADTLRCTTENALPLTELINRKTEGNPFFTTQFLKALYEEKHIRFNVSRGYWECDIAHLKTLTLSDDVVEFMALQLKKLSPQSQEILKLAACIGNQFNLGTLEIILDKPAPEIAADLWCALQEGLVIPENEVYKFYANYDPTEVHSGAGQNVTYRFLHDRVQQAAYYLIPEREKALTHHRIGQLLLAKITPEQQEEKIFELVNQLNYGKDLIESQNQRDELAKLNLIACRRAMAATAYGVARNYAETGILLLGTDGWQRQYQLSLTFHELGAEIYSLGGDFAAMEDIVETVFKEANSTIDQVKVGCIKIEATIARLQFLEAIEMGCYFLEKLGISISPNPTPSQIEQFFGEIYQIIGQQNIEDFANLPVMTDPEKQAIVKLAKTTLSAAQSSGSPVFIELTCLAVKMSLQYGNMVNSSATYVAYGLLLCKCLQDIETGYKFGQLAMKMSQQPHWKTEKAGVFVTCSVAILPQKFHLKETFPLLQEAYTTALEVGDLEFAGYALNSLCLHGFWCGQLLTTLEKQTEGYYQEISQFKRLISLKYCAIYWQVILNLIGHEKEPTVLSGKIFQEDEVLAGFVATHNMQGVFLINFFKFVLFYLWGEFKNAREYATTARQYLMTMTGTIVEPAFYLYESLAILGDLEPSATNASAQWQQIEENQTQLQQFWANYAPMNFQHKVDLVAAEKCRVLGQKSEAIELYDKAIAGAKTHQYIQEEALANELAAKFYLDWGKTKVATSYMQEAYYAYARWGAKAKTDDLERRYPEMLLPILHSDSQTLPLLNTFSTITVGTTSINTTTTATRTSSSTINNALDFTAILRASQAISGTIELEELLNQLTQIILQNSGADFCALLLPNAQGQWEVRAIATPKHTELCSQSLNNHPDLPVSLLQYVKNTKEVVLSDDHNRQRWTLKNRHSLSAQSFLGLPLLNQGQLIGIVYLENKSTRGVFTKERQFVLNFLCSQAAISLQNARLYEQAQQALEELQKAQLQLVQNEKMSALGNLVAGVAHEINNPVGFIAGNIQPAQDYVQDLFSLIDLFQSKYSDSDIEEEKEAIDLEYLREDLPKLISSMKLGVDRIAHISTSLRIFSRTDKDYKVPFNIHEGIDSTLLILKHRLKANETRPAIEIIKKYGDLPEVNCFPGQLNQVFMNLIANGIDALEEAQAGESYQEIKAHQNTIEIETEAKEKEVIIRIKDNGVGMPEEVRKRIFEQGFTTKGVGKGTGLGLAIAKQIVEEKHGGLLTVESQINQGTEFYIQLPL